MSIHIAARGRGQGAPVAEERTPGPVPAKATPGVRQRRRPAVLGLGVALVAVCGLAGGWLATRGNQSHSVVVARGELTAGQPIQASDLGTTILSGGADVSTIPGGQLSSVVGKYPNATVPGGSLVNPHGLAAAVTPGRGQSIIGVGLKPGQLPALGLKPGDRVRLISTYSAQGGAGVKPGQAWPAIVVSAGPSGDNGARTVDFMMPATQAKDAVSAAGAGTLAAVLDATSDGR